LYGEFGEVGESISSPIGDEKGIRGIEGGMRFTWENISLEGVYDVVISVIVFVMLQSSRLRGKCQQLRDAMLDM